MKWLLFSIFWLDIRLTLIFIETQVFQCSVIRTLRDRCSSTGQTKDDPSVPRLPLLDRLGVYPVRVAVLRLASTKLGVWFGARRTVLAWPFAARRSSFESGRWPAESKCVRNTSPAFPSPTLASQSLFLLVSFHISPHGLITSYSRIRNPCAYRRMAIRVPSKELRLGWMNRHARRCAWCTVRYGTCIIVRVSPHGLRALNSGVYLATLRAGRGVCIISQSRSFGDVLRYYSCIHSFEKRLLAFLVSDFSCSSVDPG